MTLTQPLPIHDDRLCEECGKPLSIDKYWGVPLSHVHVFVSEPHEATADAALDDEAAEVVPA